MKILNLYSGIGGNRKLWDEITSIEVTAVENDKEIAEIYSDKYPKDEIIIGDAHEYLRQHYREYDFIWSSPPCQTHSKFMKMMKNHPIQWKAITFPDMRLYEEIILLHHFTTENQLWVVENVESYYKPLIRPQKVGRHYYWANFNIPSGKITKRQVIQKRRGDPDEDIDILEKQIGISLRQYDIPKRKKIKALRNCVEPHQAKMILAMALQQRKIL